MEYGNVGSASSLKSTEARSNSLSNEVARYEKLLNELETVIAQTATFVDRIGEPRPPVPVSDEKTGRDGTFVYQMQRLNAELAELITRLNNERNRLEKSLG